MNELVVKSLEQRRLESKQHHFSKCEKLPGVFTKLFVVTNKPTDDSDESYRISILLTRMLCNVSSKLWRDGKLTNVETISYFPEDIYGEQFDKNGEKVVVFTTDMFNELDFIRLCVSGNYSPQFILECMEGMQKLFAEEKENKRIVFSPDNLTEDVCNYVGADEVIIIRTEFRSDILKSRFATCK